MSWVPGNHRTMGSLWVIPTSNIIFDLISMQQVMGGVFPVDPLKAIIPLSNPFAPEDIGWASTHFSSSLHQKFFRQSQWQAAGRSLQQTHQKQVHQTIIKRISLKQNNSQKKTTKIGVRKVYKLTLRKPSAVQNLNRSSKFNLPQYCKLQRWHPWISSSLSSKLSS